MKRVLFLSLLTLLVSPIFRVYAEDATTSDNTPYSLGAEDLDTAVSEIDSFVSGVSGKVPPFLSDWYNALEQYRQKKYEDFKIKLAEYKNETIDQLEIGNVDFNESGNIEIGTGISQVEEKPKEYIMTAIYGALVFVFGSAILFFAVLFLILLMIIKIIINMFRKK